jgi:branched-chain amino acid transport system permease protein
LYGRIGLVLLALVAALVWFLPSYYTGLLTLIALYALVTIGLNLFMGYAGQVSLGQAAFFGIGAYTSAALAVKTLGTPWHVSPWLGTLAGALVAAFAAYVLSFVALRLRENLLAEGTGAAQIERPYSEKLVSIELVTAYRADDGGLVAGVRMSGGYAFGPVAT